MEALKPEGMVHIHPYVLVKLRDDPRLHESVLPAHRAGILRCWRPSKLAAMATEQIQTKLGLHGVLYDREGFVERTKSRQSAWDIAEEWGAPLVGLSPQEEDFLGLAACELWRRLCPERPSLEMIDDWLCEGYGFAGQKKPREALAAWWRVWEVLRPRITPELKNLDGAGERLFPRMSQCLSNWSGDFRLEALNASLDDAHCGEIGIRFIRELLEAFPQEDDRLNFRGDLALIYFHLRRDAEAEESCQQLIRDHPERAMGYVTLSDRLLGRRSKAAPDRAKVQRAIDLLEQALAYPVEDAEDFDVASRLATARGLLLT